MMRLRAAMGFVPALLLVLSCLGVSGQDSGLTVGATGSGFVVTSDGYILTNEHVIHDATKVTVHAAGQVYEAAVVAASEANDLALLKIPASGLTSVQLGNFLSVEPLEPVVAMGYPKAGYGEDLTTSTGEITSIRTNVPGREGKDTLQHDAVITYGSSGGPLFSARGEVIGVNFAGDPPLNWAIPINDAIPLLRSITGFDLKTMGQATTTMPASEVVDTYKGAVVFIDCTSEIALHEMLPSPQAIPGFDLAGGYCVCEGGVAGGSARTAVVSSEGEAQWWCSNYGTGAWLSELGYPVTGWANMLAPLDFSILERDKWYSIDLIAFSDAGAVANAMPILLSRTPDSQLFYSADGQTQAAGVGATYRLEAVKSGPETLRAPYLRGQVIFALGRVGVRVSIVSQAELGVGQYAYRDGYLVFTELGSSSGSGERIASMDALAAQLQQVADIAATVALNRLRY